MTPASFGLDREINRRTTEVPSGVEEPVPVTNALANVPRTLLQFGTKAVKSNTSPIRTGLWRRALIAARTPLGANPITSLQVCFASALAVAPLALGGRGEDGSAMSPSIGRSMQMTDTSSTRATSTRVGPTYAGWWVRKA